MTHLKGNRIFLLLWHTLSYSLLVYSGFLIIMGCTSRSSYIDEAERSKVDSLVSLAVESDSLVSAQRYWAKEGKMLESVVALRMLGKKYRNESRFEEALRVHQEGLRQSEKLRDTLEIVQALNNIGTDYRRLDVYDLATSYHYRALRISDACGDTTYMFRKNRVVSLNGLANVYMSIGNDERADSVLRLALAGEIALKSALGQAINCANIGSIFEKRGQIDSAWVYYKRSMTFNRAAGSQLGIALCHTYYGTLYEKEKRYVDALAEHKEAYRMMADSKDEWHAMNSLISLARIRLRMGNTDTALLLLQKAEQKAGKIKSIGHLSEVHALYGEVYEKQGRWQDALKSHLKADSFREESVSMAKLNQIQNVTIRMERNMQELRMAEAKKTLEAERRSKWVGFGVLTIVSMFLAILAAAWWYVSRNRLRTQRKQKELIAMREEFFTNVTHEFRTPLTVILGLCKEIEDDNEVTHRIQHLAKTVRRQGDNLLVLVNQLLDISKIKSGGLGKADMFHGDICAFARMVTGEYMEYAKSQGVNLDFSSTEEVMTVFSPEYMTKILTNLIGNALKYTPQNGSINVGLMVERETFRIFVKDTGEGIPPDAIPHIFEPFYQVPDNKAITGSGIGLTLVNQIVSSLGGHVEVSSELGVGSRFEVILPLHTRHEAVPEWSGNIDKETFNHQHKTSSFPRDAIITEYERPRLLIVEDNADVAQYMGRRLQGEYDVFYATDGEMGLAKAKEVVPDIVVADLMMPILDGLSMCRKMREDEVVSHIPVVVVTAKVTEDDRIKVFEAGADAYMQKPFSASELSVRLRGLLEQRKRLQIKYANDMEGHVKAKGRDRTELQFLAKVVDCVYQQLRKCEPADVHTVAIRMCMSESQFYRKILSVTGEPPASYIRHIKIRCAKQLLREKPELSMAEVAQFSGFGDYSGFVRAFKNECGVSPRQFARS